MMHPSFIAACEWRRRDLIEEAAQVRQSRLALSQAERALAEQPPFAREAPFRRFVVWLRRRPPMAAAPGGAS